MNKRSTGLSAVFLLCIAPVAASRIPIAGAVSYPICSVQNYTTANSTSYCILPAGGSITVQVKSGNGGDGGAGGAGGNGGTDGSYPGGVGGAGGAGGSGGSGAKSELTWTNSGASSVTLQIYVAPTALSSPAASSGLPGTNGTNPSPDGTDGGDGTSGTGSQAGGSGGPAGDGANTSVGYGGFGGDGGNGGAGSGGGNGGAGGAGGNGGAALSGFDSGGDGGAGGNGGDGADGGNGAAGGAGGNGGDGLAGSWGGDGAASGNGGNGGDGIASFIQVVETSTTLLAPNPGRGGTGGTGGSGGTGGTSSGAGVSGTNGTNGSNGADGTGGNLTTSSSEAPNIAFATVTIPETPASPTATAPTITLELDANGGTCSIASASGASGTWIQLPDAQACSQAGRSLQGWRVHGSNTVYPPGSAVYLSADNTLTALWSERSPSTGSVTPTNGSPGADDALQRAPRFVIWAGRGGKARVGDPAALAGAAPIFTVVARNPRSVDDAVVERAKSLAERYGGTYAGIVQGKAWKKPRVVAAYQTP